MRDQHFRQFPDWPPCAPVHSLHLVTGASCCIILRPRGSPQAAGKPPPPAMSDAAPGWSDDAPGTQRVATLNPSCIRLWEAAEFSQVCCSAVRLEPQHDRKAKSGSNASNPEIQRGAAGGLGARSLPGHWSVSGHQCVSEHPHRHCAAGQNGCGYRLPRCPSFQARVESETHRITWPPITGETAQRAKGCWLLATGQSSASAEALPLPLPKFQLTPQWTRSGLSRVGRT